MAQPHPAIPPPGYVFPTKNDLNDIQGDVILGIPKRFQNFLFFTIQDPAEFKRDLKRLIPAITTTAQIQGIRDDIKCHKSEGHHGLLKVIGTNIAFTFQGLQKLGINESIGDPAFEAGQLGRAESVLSDQLSNWMPQFKDVIHGLIMICGDCKRSVDEGAHNAQHIFGGAIRQVLKVEGNVRPDKEKGHEHFGFLDGISNPAIFGLTKFQPGQQVIDPGVLILGQLGDDVQNRPQWTKNGSVLVYRHLEQLVPEFNKFLIDNPITEGGLTREEGSKLLGARLVGRWKSGAPIDVTPLQDNPDLAKDPTRNNFFDFQTGVVTDQTRCPFAAHIRKTNPRTDIVLGERIRHSIMRSGIPFGPEVTRDEEQSGKTSPDKSRGLSFVCYQSAVGQGFEFIQRNWANNQRFPFNKVAIGQPASTAIVSGFDPIIGQNGGNARVVNGTNPQAQGNNLTLPQEFVISRGGAYFFVPSISALKTKLSV